LMLSKNTKLLDAETAIVRFLRPLMERPARRTNLKDRLVLPGSS
jgi:hypothetical protein